MIVKSSVTDDARVRRGALAVAAMGHQLTVIGDRPGPPDPIPEVEVVFVRDKTTSAGGVERRGLALFARWLGLPTHRRRDDRAFARRVAAVSAGMTPDLVHAHDLSGLEAAAPFSARHVPIVYDAHECWTGRRLAGRPAPVQRWLDGRSERRAGTRALRVLTVSPALARWFEERYGWSDVAVVRNSFPEVPPGPTTVRPRCLLYAGRIDHKRDLRTIAAGANILGDMELVVRGSGESAEARILSAAGARVEPSIPIDDLTEELRSCGISVVSLLDDQHNHRVALPNKVFQAVQAGVPVIAADLPSLRELVDEHRIGELYTPGDVDSFVAAVNRLRDDFDATLERVERAKSALSWSVDELVLRSVYADLQSQIP